MFIELVDRLRCLQAHEETWLVATSGVMRGRHIVNGHLGCPICRARYPIREGVADFRADTSVSAAPAPLGAAPAIGDDETVRLAALLALADVHGVVVLAGAWAPLAPALLDVVPATYLLVNAADVPDRTEISALLASGALPLAAGSAHGVALDDAAAGDAGLVAGAVRALRGGGRLVAPAAATMPEGVLELGRDERHWVAEREAVGSAPSAPVELRRAP